MIYYLCFIAQSEPLSLQDLCRCRIRIQLRANVWHEHPELESKNLVDTDVNKVKPETAVERCILPYYNGMETHTSSSDDDEDETIRPRLFLYVDAHAQSTIQKVRIIASSNCDEWKQRDFFKMNDSDEESNEINQPGTNTNNEPRIYENFPSTSQQNNVAIDPLKESINIENQSEQSSSTNINKTTRGKVLSDTDDSLVDMELETDNDQLLMDKNSLENDNGSGTAKRRLSSLLEQDSSTSNSSSDEEEENSSMEWLNVIQKAKWGISEYMSSSEGYPNSCSHQSEAIKPDNQQLGLRPAQVFAHNVDINVFSSHMKDKISQLPLPMSLRLYINYNRNL